jgi:hypothetical protein
VLGLCLGSFLVILLLVAIFFWSALGVAKRADSVRYGIPFWLALEAAKRDDSILCELYELDEIDLDQPEEEKVHFPRPIPSIDV